MPYVFEMKLPRLMYGPAIFSGLRDAQTLRVFLSMVQWHRQHVRSAVREPDPRSCQRHLHDFTREIARGMQHVLVGRSDSSASRVVVRPEVRRNASPLRGSNQGKQINLTYEIEDGLRCLDHQLHTKRVLLKTEN